MADVDRERVTALWREAAARLAPAFDEMDAESLRAALGDAWADPLHGWEAAEIENARLRAECGRLREQLDAADKALIQAHADVVVLSMAGFALQRGRLAVAAAERIECARAALGVVGEEERPRG